MDEFTLTPDGHTFQPTASLRIKVLDVPAEERLWPEEQAGRTLLVTAPQRQGAPPQTLAEQRKAEDDFAKLAHPGEGVIDVRIQW